MAVGHGGQVLVSNSTAALLTGVDLVDLGEHRLRDLSGAEHLFQVRAEGLATGFPLLKTVNAVPGNLPMQATSFVGRGEEIRELSELVRAHRLVTLTGVGGVGKTRLAVQVAAELVPNVGDGVWLVELVPVGDPAAVPDAVASALGIIVQAGMTVTASVANALAGRQLLIVLDNCEHVHRCCTTTPAIPFDTAWASYWEANARINAGRPDRCVEILTDLATRTGPARVMGLFRRVLGLAYAGRSGEAMAIADDGLNAARVHANPYWIANAYYGYGRAFTETDPARALDTFRVGLAYTRQHRVPFFEALIARDAAGLEAVHGDLDQALTLFTTSIDLFHQAGDPTDLAGTFAHLAVFFDRINRPEIAATLYGTTTHDPAVNMIIGFVAAVDHVRNTLDTDTFDHCAAAGAAMDTAEAVRYARTRIEAV